jgi:hypothetical protein
MVPPHSRETRNKQQPPQSSFSKKHHHLAVIIVSPARHSAAARHRARMSLQNRTSQANLSPPDKPHIAKPKTASATQSIKFASPALTHKQQQRSTSKTILHSPIQPSQRRCSTQQPPRACFAGSRSRRQPAHNKHRVSRSMVPHPLSKHATAPSKQLLQKASPGPNRCLPSTTQRRRSTPHMSDTAKSHVTSPLISA